MVHIKSINTNIVHIKVWLLAIINFLFETNNVSGAPFKHLNENSDQYNVVIRVQVQVFYFTKTFIIPVLLVFLFFLFFIMHGARAAIKFENEVQLSRIC